MRQVAHAAGVSVGTVSKALRNDPSISEERCRALHAAARRLGYRPNPMVATLMAQLHHQRRRSDPQNLAWVDLWPAKKDRAAVMNAKPLLRGAEERARELGYGIELVPAGAQRLSPRQLRRLLTARGQWGLIIPPVPEFAMSFPLDLRGLTGVTIGSSLHEPVMHRVSPNHFQGGVLAVERLRSDGFTRIGLALTPEMNQRVEGKWLGAFLACQQALPQKERVAPLIAARGDAAGFERWQRREHPDVVLVAEDFAGIAASRAKAIPREPPSVAWLMLPGGPRDLGGLDYRPEQLGRVAVELVVAQIHRNERGCPPIPQTVLIDGVWVGSAPPGAPPQATLAASSRRRASSALIS